MKKCFDHDNVCGPVYACNEHEHFQDLDMLYFHFIYI